MQTTSSKNSGESYYTTGDMIVIRKKAVIEIHPDRPSIRLSGGLYLIGIRLTGEIDEKDIPADCTIIS